MSAQNYVTIVDLTPSDITGSVTVGGTSYPYSAGANGGTSSQIDVGSGDSITITMEVSGVGHTAATTLPNAGGADAFYTLAYTTVGYVNMYPSTSSTNVRIPG